MSITTTHQRLASTYPAAPGHQGADTSIAAASAISPVSARFQIMALRAIREAGVRGLTAEELSDQLGYPRTTLQPRTTELKIAGLIRDSRWRRYNRSEHRAIVWVAVLNTDSNGLAPITEEGAQ